MVNAMEVFPKSRRDGFFTLQFFIQDAATKQALLSTEVFRIAADIAKIARRSIPKSENSADGMRALSFVGGFLFI